MPDQSNRFRALAAFQSAVQSAYTLQDLQDTAVAFMREQLGADTVRIADSTIPDEGSADVTLVPIQQTGYSLRLSRENPLDEEETAVVKIAASLMTDAPFFEKTTTTLQRQLEELNTLYEANISMTAKIDRDDVLQTVVAEMAQALKLDSCTIFVWDVHHRKLKPAAHHNGLTASDTEPQLMGLNKVAELAEHPALQQIMETPEIRCLRRDESASEVDRHLLEAADLQTVLLAPLMRQDKFLGLLGMGQKTAARIFTDHELRLTKNLADQAAVAVEHANLFRQAQRRIQELSTFQEIVLQLNTPLKLSEVLATITKSALKLVDASNMHIYLYNPETDAFTFGSALWQDGRREPAVPAPRKEGLTMAVVHKGKPIVINDASSHPLFQSEKSRSWGICSIAGFPLRHGNQVIGAFTATFLHSHTFSEDEQLLLSLLADQAAVAVRNAGLFAGSQRRLRGMAALVDMAKQVTGNLKLRSVLQTTVQTIKGLLGARASTITMLSENAAELVVVAAAGADPEAVGKARMKLGEGVSGQVVRAAKLLYIRDAHGEPDFLFFDEVVRSLLVVPLIIRDRAIGTMTVDSAQPNAFSESDIQLMMIAAAQVSVAIANARLFEALEERAAELAAAYEELKESDRLKDELVQNVSHELRTPLTFVKGYVDLLMEGEMGLVTPHQQEALLIVAEKTDEITRLIEDIITLQRIDAGNLQLEKVSLAEMIKTAVASHTLVADKKGMRIAPQIPDGIADLAFVDKQRINQVLDNIIGNALKFSPDGGIITVTLFEEGDMIGIAVSDQGVGVPEDKRERIFERFYQVDGSARRRFGGTGVGLAIVKRIVDAHQGHIWVESEVREGSTFFITLPKAARQVAV